MVNKRNIYEYDLMKFFDRVNGVYIIEQLMKMGFPKAMSFLIQDLHRSTPTLPDKQLMDETPILEKNALDQAIRQRKAITDHAALREWKLFEELNGVEFADMLLMEEFGPTDIKADKNLCKIKYSELQ